MDERDRIWINLLLAVMATPLVLMGVAIITSVVELVYGLI